MPSVNERLADAAIDRAVDLHQYANGVVRRMLAVLNRADADISSALLQALDTMPAESFSVERLDSLLGSVRLLLAQAYQQLGRDLPAEMLKLAEAEATYQLELFRSVIPPQVIATVGVAQVEVAQVYAAAMARPFQGRLLREWAQSLEADKAARIRDAVRMGYVEQETIPQIVRRVIGTRAKGYSDGIIELDRRHAETIVRTAVSHTAGTVRDRMIEANSDLIKTQSWASTLDTKTSPICRPRDGKQYTPKSPYKPIGHGFPWLGGPGRAHFNCRSVAVPITKSWRELGVNMDEMTPTERASMDGTVPAEQTFGQWLKKQSAGRQDEVLGPVRAGLFRKGMALDEFYSDKGRYLSIEELMQRGKKVAAKP